MAKQDKWFVIGNGTCKSFKKFKKAMKYCEQLWREGKSVYMGCRHE